MEVPGSEIEGNVVAFEVPGVSKRPAWTPLRIAIAQLESSYGLQMEYQ